MILLISSTNSDSPRCAFWFNFGRIGNGSRFNVQGSLKDQRSAASVKVPQIVLWSVRIVRYNINIRNFSFLGYLEVPHWGTIEARRSKAVLRHNRAQWKLNSQTGKRTTKRATIYNSWDVRSRSCHKGSDWRLQKNDEFSQHFAVFRHSEDILHCFCSLCTILQNDAEKK